MKVLYITPGVAHTGSAGWGRMLGVARSLRHSGHTVTLAGQRVEGGSSVSEASDEGLRVLTYAPPDRGGWAPWAKRRWDAGLGSLLGTVEEAPDVLISYGGNGGFVSLGQSWAAQWSVPRIVDSVEWYDPRHLPGGRLGPAAFDNELSMRRRFPAFDGTIAISTYLADYYRSAGQHVIRVPPTLDVRSIFRRPKERSEVLTLVYAGTPGRKDSLGNIIQAINDIDPTGSFVCLNVFGIDENEATRLPCMPSRKPSSVAFHGRVTNARAREMISQAHYLPFLRPSMRYANAGFPTKVVEAMAMGTPVIGNLTSDLGEHLRDGETAIVSQEHEFGLALERALSGGTQLAEQLSQAAHRHANAAFDFRQYSRCLDELIQGVVS